MKNYQMTIYDEQDLDKISPCLYRHMGAVYCRRENNWDDSNNVFYFRYGNNDMMFYVFKGEADYSKTIPMQKGDKFFFQKGSECKWQTLTPFAKLFIQTYSSQKHDDPDSLSFRTLIKLLDNHKTENKRPDNHHLII